MESIAGNLAAIRQRIDAACIKAGRNPESVRLIAVSKTKPTFMIKEAFEAGQIDFGESYVQEFLEKQSDLLLENLPVRWHFIGHLQSNKVRAIIGRVALIHGIDRYSTAEELSKRAVQQNISIEYLLEVNTSGESTKYGLRPEDLTQHAPSFFSLPNITLRGLMTIASADPALARHEFSLLKRLLVTLKESAPDPSRLTELSMGMSQDFEAAIAEGATLIRVGTAVFGWR
ncbi:MAG: YggS family pyridoxal phosphate-dependent enzyme [Chlorobium sp.]|jgi:pyridoxal phosphate enzyme (YggS family)|uniref:YggS family pyridoxal phosphate-dependent enzyme n=1 Tax=Chlorobium sp. TaxID=1095 RepID=UPI0025BC32A6|nr:YggS family pyridoxal phosphate-dependent enzyme [Chlorobium sp.]MCF8215944.1 YggS family pyridoxal phosphate-dependent enzyme [Chlorobium sp.]MCF8270842.1 YggS family pyridoxal phosphate-dependent enzyme [Chlorobium sp.]MCF8287154.1 YggS family pyridoxal phosphate-dependent enzyme [Chlorobium sp.]MCF8290811.1 YggS family pyridoxal phosphate-dependent enzyme [Chlorobium sp.]MCF8384915.1 YggS family pyridoxal phosphate-dependent enzyme [Chlorobium sp.]